MVKAKVDKGNNISTVKTNNGQNKDYDPGNVSKALETVIKLFHNRNQKILF